MSLDWKLDKIANRETVCWVGDEEPKLLNPVTESLTRLDPEPARPAAESASTDWLSELEAVQTLLEDAWTALCKQDWDAGTQNVFDARASVTKLVESARGHSDNK